MGRTINQIQSHIIALLEAQRWNCQLLWKKRYSIIAQSSSFLLFFLLRQITGCHNWLWLQLSPQMAHHIKGGPFGLDFLLVLINCDNTGHSFISSHNKREFNVLTHWGLLRAMRLVFPQWLHCRLPASMSRRSASEIGPFCTTASTCANQVHNLTKSPHCYNWTSPTK